MSVFSDSTNKNGLIQTFEFWTRLPDGTVTGTLLKQITARINAAHEKIMPLLLSYSDFIRWDDTNHTDRPIGLVDIVSGQNDYTIATDDNSLDILNITAVRALPSATATQYSTLTRLDMNDERVLEAMSPNTNNSGVPTHYVENGNNLFLYPNPNYAVTSGIKVFFSREQSYFVSTDTTKEPGIPKPFHELLALYAALDWNVVNQDRDNALIGTISQRIRDIEKGLQNFIDLRNPTKLQITFKQVNHR